MIVELDCGNSFIKWRIIDAFSRVLSSGVVESIEELVHALDEARTSHEFAHCRMVSVRSDDEVARLESVLAQRFGLRVSAVRPASCLAGVRNGYLNHERLGLDRWMAVVAAYRLSAGACLVLDLGTAVTADFVDADGEHRGGIHLSRIAAVASSIARAYQAHPLRCRCRQRLDGRVVRSGAFHGRGGRAWLCPDAEGIRRFPVGIGQGVLGGIVSRYS